MKNFKLLSALFLCLCATQAFGFATKSISNSPIWDFISKIGENCNNTFGGEYFKNAMKNIASEQKKNYALPTDLSKCSYTKDELRKEGYGVDPNTADVITVQEIKFTENCNKENPDYELSPTSKNTGVRTNLGVLK